MDDDDLGEIPSVDAGSTLMKTIAPIAGIDGKSVTGGKIKARQGKSLNFEQCKGAEVSPDNPDLLVSTTKGQPVLSNREITIEKIYIVDSVGLQSGHIDFDGIFLLQKSVLTFKSARS